MPLVAPELAHLTGLGEVHYLSPGGRPSHHVDRCVSPAYAEAVSRRYPAWIVEWQSGAARDVRWFQAGEPFPWPTEKE
jgi:hypothetical protein